MICVPSCAHRVLTEVSVTVPAGERAGLIGENGSGKPTLLRIVAGLIAPDAGPVTARVPGGTGARVALLHQRPPLVRDATIASALGPAVAAAPSAEAGVALAASALAAAPS